MQLQSVKNDEILEEINSLKFFNAQEYQNLDHFNQFKVSVHIRSIEEAIVALAKDNKLRGPIHSYVGEEAIATGVLSHAKPIDSVTSTHRGHGHYIAKGGNISKLIDELHGKETGCNGGKGGSMHVADLSINHFGANGIVGGGVPIACGIAFANKLDKKDSLVFCFFGDGASNQGVVLESFNLAGFLSLPIIFICENNQFAQSTKLSDISLTSVAKKSQGFGIKSIEIDGLNISEVSSKTSDAVNYTRNEMKPYLIQANTYRFHRHFVSERPKPIDYLDENFHKNFLSKDPIINYCHQNKIAFNLLEEYITNIKNIIFNYSKKIS
tara:strand:+ start:7316 stop:8290 length:975 start_codon:yes stop_codon:yes gene_type:complete